VEKTNSIELLNSCGAFKTLKCPLKLDYSGCGMFHAEEEEWGSSYLVLLPSVGILSKLVHQSFVHSFQNASFIIVTAGGKRKENNGESSSKSYIRGFVYMDFVAGEQHMSLCIHCSERAPFFLLNCRCDF